MRLRSSKSLNRVTSRHGSWDAEEAWVRAELNASKAVVEIRECTKWQPHQMRAILVSEAPVTVSLEPLSAREMRCVHVDDPVIHLSIVYWNSAMYESRGKQAPDRLLLPSCDLNDFILSLTRCSAKTAPMLGHTSSAGTSISSM